MQSILDLLPRIEELGDREAIRFTNGVRSFVTSYRELNEKIGGLARELDARGVGRGDRALLWGENRAEWVAFFWACLARGVTVVPLDFHSSPDLVARVQARVEAKILLHQDALDAGGLPVARIGYREAAERRASGKLEPVSASPDEVVQILFTSGTTGDPKGVVHRHRNLTANLTPVAREIRKYRALAWPFQPVRFLELLPLSHIFGQLTGLYLPPIFGGSVVFMSELHPSAILRTIHDERVSVLVSVPRFLANLRKELERHRGAPRPALETPGVPGALLKWWRYRDLHRRLGWKFWALVSGGARLDVDEEAFWFELGLVLVQGYGLTETSSMVTSNHPLHPRRGSLGTIVGKQQIRLAPDGEILVRGENVSAELFGQNEKERSDSSEWLHTGDLGEIDEEGVLYYRGRKKDVIVGADGLNVYPLDVEAALSRHPAVEDAVVIAKATAEGEVVHAVLRMRTEAAPAEVVSEVNRGLEAHQRIRGWTIWPDDDFPRTASTFKVKRHEVAARIEGGVTPSTESTGSGSGSVVRGLVAAKLGRDLEELDPDADLSADLGLSSIDRIELLTELETRLGARVEEHELAEVSTLQELEERVQRSTPPERDAAVSAVREESSPLDGLPGWTRVAPIRWLRGAFRETVTLPLFHHYLPLTVEGSLAGIEPPVLFAANHESHLDTLAILAALPYSWRWRLAPAMGQDFFRGYLEGRGPFRERAIVSLQYALACILVHAYPLPQSTKGIREALRFTGELVEKGYCPLIYPEGERSPDGAMKPFRGGVGMMAVSLSIPVVPIRLDGLFEILPLTRGWPKAGPVRLRFGAPLRFGEKDDVREVTASIESAVRALPLEGSAPE